MLRDFGQTITLRRLGSPNIDVSCLAMVAGYRPDQMADGVVQGDRRVTISNTEIAAAGWPGPPRKGDKCIIAGVPTTVLGCETATIGSEMVKHTLQVHGG